MFFKQNSFSIADSSTMMC